MIRLSQLLGTQAIDVSTATVTGTVSGIALDAHRIVSIGVAGLRIDARTVHGFDGEVVTYLPTRQDRPTQVTSPSDPRGSRVLDLRGDLLGTITDLVITGNGLVDTIVLHDGSALPGTRLRVVGSYAAIVSEHLVGESSPTAWLG